MPSVDYAYQKLLSALDSLATGSGDVRSRILNAFMAFHTLEEDDFPEHLRADFTWIMEQIKRHGPLIDHNGEVWRGSVENTMNRIRRSTGVKIADRILYLYHELDSIVHNR